MHVRVGVLGLTLVVSASVAASAQTPASAPPLANAVQILPATRLSALSDSLPSGAINTVQLGRFPGLANAINRRDTSGMQESHEDFTDIFVIQKGGARLLYGGTADGARVTSPGEWRGGTIRGGTETAVHPGDVVVIPAGIPHQFVLSPGESVVYLSFKSARKGAQ
jgi:mannose-6-phosphate isomerase-like protein (cupin superfamily)